MLNNNNDKYTVYIITNIGFFYMLYRIRMITIDPLLTDAILNKSEYQTINKLGRDQIIQR